MQVQDNEIWLTKSEVAVVSGLKEYSVQKACQRGQYKTVLVDGNGGKQYRIALSSLPVEAQIKYILENKAEAGKLSQDVTSRLAPQARWEIIKLKEPQTAVKITARDKVSMDAAKKVEIVLKAMDVPPGYKKDAWKVKLAADYGLTKATVCDYIRTYNEGGIAAFTAERASKGLTAWSPEALEFMQGVFLKTLRTTGDASKRTAYKMTCAEAVKQKWKVGSESGAYSYLDKQNFNPLLEKYARGGSRALDNIFFIPRDYSDLKPFEIIVGDQHRFDFWVKDVLTGEVFRPEAFCWEDMFTAAIYGISCAPNYNSYLVGHAMRMGMKRFGAFRSCYTDNGKPECSKYMANVMRDIAAVGAKGYDLPDLYKTKDGAYAVVNEDGEIIDSAVAPEAWHRKARKYNAKAKMIERLFRSIEQIMANDLNVPGLIRELHAIPEEQALADKRLKKAMAEDKLLPYEEFVVALMKAIQIYENRRHSRLKMSPLAKLLESYNGGWRPIFINDADLDFILLARDERAVQRGRVLINGMWYEGDEMTQGNLNAGLWHIPNKTRIEVRSDLFDPSTAIAVTPDKEIRYLHPVDPSSMKDDEKTAAKMEWKRRMMRAVADEYRRLIKPVTDAVIGMTQMTGKLAAAKKSQPIQKMEPAALKAETERIVRESTAPAARKNIRVIHKIFKAPFEHYEWCIDSQLEGYELTKTDKEFMASYEETMTPEEKLRWECHRKTHQVRAAG